MNHLLMIDDDEKLVALVREYLEGQGFRLSVAHDGQAGLDAIRSGDHDLVILDLMLPEIDGLEVCRRLRAFSQVPVLMLTARGDATDRIVGLEIGADDYLPKPFEARELLARIRAILRRIGGERAAARSGPVVVGALVVDPAARRVRLGGREIELTTAEFDLLFALARSAGRVLTREQLLEQLHDGPWAADDRSIDVHISRLRQKIDKDFDKPLLHTVRGAGYRMTGDEG